MKCKNSVLEKIVPMLTDVVIRSCDFTNNVNNKNYNYLNNRQQFNNINFCAKNDVLVKKTVTTRKTYFFNLLNKIKLLFKNKQNIENAKRAGISLEEYERNLEIVCPKHVRNYEFTDFMPMGCFPDCSDIKGIEREFEAMLKRIEFWQTKKNINIFNKEDENQIKTMINKIKDKISKQKEITDDELEEIGDFWNSKVLYPYC